MGLLTDPSGGQGKLTKLLLKYYAKICFLLYAGGIIWFCALAHAPMNANTYFSENALLPGLVKSQFHEEQAAQRFYEELQDEMIKYDDCMPYSWIIAKFKQIGLDTYTHNFTLNSPLNPKERYVGKNVYGILRAARASSTEALVLSVPYRPPSSVHGGTSASVALMMAFAKYANKEKYWAKDIIFLITEHEQLGVQSWLEAYHGVSCGSENVLDHGDLRGRAGAIQAAINLELHAPKIAQIDIKIEGLNGQLPNLDLFNLAAKMCMKEGVYHTFKGKSTHYHRDPIKEWWSYFKNMMLMVGTQATGIPNGNHGLFHRFGIQALTIEGFEQSKARGSSKVGFVTLGRIVEGTFRSLNNLLERFHQSFFFYLLPSSDRYISIGLYIPSVCFLAGALFIKACAKWCKTNEDSEDQEKNTEKEHSRTVKASIDYIKIVIMFLLIHSFGILLLNIPQLMVNLTQSYELIDSANYVYHAILTTCGMSLLLPFVMPKLGEGETNILNVGCLLELGTALICIAMNNFSLGMVCATVSVPVVLLVNATSCRSCSMVQKLLLIIIHPLTVLFIIVLVNTYMMFSNEHTSDILKRAYDATQKAVIYSIVDSMIYGNWMYSVITSIFIPNWICFYCVTFKQQTVTKANDEKKNN